MTPRSLDTGTGPEPDWKSQPDPELRKSSLTFMFNWYNYYYGKKEARDCIVDWLFRNGRDKESAAFARIPESVINRMAVGWLCRANLLGLVLLDDELAHINQYIAENIESHKQVKQVVEVAEAPVVNKPNIQDRLREKMIEAAGELEGMLDEMIKNGAKMSADYKPVSLLRSMNIAPQMVNDIAQIWKVRLTEFEAAVAGKDAQLVEGYGHLGKLQLKNLVKFAETVINDCGAYVQIKKVERKPRKAKPVSPEKRAAKFKCLMAFDELKLKGLPASQLVDKSEAWLYDTKKRKLIHVVADNHVGAFTVKSNAIIGFGTVDTVQKTLRKPADVLKALAAAGKPAARKLFKDLTTTETPFNGRGTENLIILKTW